MKSIAVYRLILPCLFVILTSSGVVLAKAPSRGACVYKEYAHYRKPFIQNGYIYRDYCIDNTIASECDPDPINEPDNFYECRTDYQAGGRRNFSRIEDCEASEA